MVGHVITRRALLIIALAAALWSLWLSAVMTPYPTVIATRDLLKDIAMPAAVLLLAATLNARATEIAQSRSALLPHVYKQIQNSWMPICMRCQKLQRVAQAIALSADARERAFYQIIALGRELQTAFYDYGTIVMKNQLAEDVVLVAQEFIQAWLDHTFGIWRHDEFVELVEDARHTVAELSRRYGKLPLISGMKTTFDDTIRQRPTDVTAFVHVTQLLQMTLLLESNEILGSWYVGKVAAPYQDFTVAMDAFLAFVSTTSELPANTERMVTAAKAYQASLQDQFAG